MRFHFGISFRWKTIRKFLLPLLLGILAYFGFGGIFSHFNPGFFKPYLLQVKAYESTGTKYTYDIPDYKTDMTNISCSNTTLFDYVNYIIDNIDFSTSSYQLYIGVPTLTSSTKLTLSIVPNDIANIMPRGYHTRYSNLGYITFPYQTTGGSVWLYFSNCSSVSDMYSLPFTTQLIDFIQNGTAIESSIAYKDGVYNYSASVQSSVSSYFTMTPMAISTTSNNSASVWWYYASKPLYYNYIDNNNDYIYKVLYLANEDITINKTDFVPSYYDLYVHSGAHYVGYQDELKSFYTSLSPSDVSSYQLKVKFNVPQSILGFYQTPQEYVNNTTFDFVCGGRVDNTNYYSYDSFNCSLTSSYVITDNSIEYTFSNYLSDHTLTGYDKLYITIKTNYLDSNISRTIYDYSYTYTLGSFYNTDYKGSIYENFTNLPLNFKAYFSSNNSLPNSKLYVSKYNFINYNIKYSGFSNTTNSQTSVIGSSILGNANINQPEFSNEFIETSVSNSIDTGILIYQDNSGIVLPSLDLFFNGGMVISFNNSSFDSFYYIDNNGDIVYGAFTPPIIEESTKYDISYYTSYVSNFINDLSSGSLVIASYTQEFYNSMPMVFQAFLLTMFILACIYFIYIAIKR